MRMHSVMAILLSVAVLLTATPALAQMAAVNPPNWDQITDQTMAAVKAQYGLTDDQVQKIRPLLRAHLPKLRGVFEAYVGAGVDAAPALLKQYQDIRADFKAKVDPILTEPQRKQFMAIREEFDAEMKKALIDARVQWFQRQIGTDAAQAEKLRPVVTENFEKRLQLFANSPDTKDSATVQKTLRVQLQVLQGETDAKLKTILTPEQMGKYQDARGGAAPAGEDKPPAR
jgi:hypothetical protein